jgi:hypothetical protein
VANTWTAKVQHSVETLELENARAVRKLRESYEQGRWAAATPAQRRQTRRGFRIRQAQLRRLRAWLAAH